jgi:hypothetical protein
VLRVVDASGMLGNGGVVPLTFLRDDAALKARDARGEAGSGVLLLGGSRRLRCTDATFALGNEALVSFAVSVGFCVGRPGTGKCR